MASRTLTRRRPPLCPVVAAWLVVALAASPLAQTGARSRIVAIGDVHGAYDNLVEILKRADLIDDTRRWTGGNATLVQLGDFTDRGPGVRRVMDLFIALEAQSRNAGGRVITLLGNHEVMNLLGETRDVSPATFASFADAESDARREAAYKAYVKLASTRAAVLPTPPAVYRQSREAWMAAHPPGFVEYREALSPRGEYGRWLRSKPMVTMIRDTIFMHAGVQPGEGPGKLDDLNTRLRDEIRRFDASLQRLVDRKAALPFFTLQEMLELSAAEIDAASAVVGAARENGSEPDLSPFDTAVLQEAQQMVRMGSWMALAPEGPLWFRGYAMWESDEAAANRMTKLLAKYKAARFVVGHTPIRSGTITSRFGGRVFLIDTGMLTSYYAGGQPSALEIDGGKYTAIYLDKKVALTEIEAGAAAR